MDIETLLSSNLLVLLVFLISFSIISLHGNFTSFSRDWAFARTCLILALCGFILELSYPVLSALCLPEILLILGFAADCRAAEKFAGKPAPKRFYSILATLSVAGLGFAVLSGNPRMATLVTNGALAILAAVTASRYLSGNLTGLISRFPLAAGFCLIGFENAFNLGEDLTSSLYGADLMSDSGQMIRHLLTSLIYVTITGAFSLTMAFEKTAMEQADVARRDPLTGIFNRTEFQQRLEGVLSDPQRKTFALIGIDIDHFKTFNDTFGHLAGDNALKSVTSVIRGAIRKNDCFARLGGEEFAVLMPGTHLDEARQIAERIRTRIAQTPMDFIDDTSYRLTISAGLFHGRGDGLTGEEIMEIADRKLYEAKHKGRNRIIIAGTAAA